VTGRNCRKPAGERDTLAWHGNPNQRGAPRLGRPPARSALARWVRAAYESPQTATTPAAKSNAATRRITGSRRPPGRCTPIPTAPPGDPSLLVVLAARSGPPGLPVYRPFGAEKLGANADRKESLDWGPSLAGVGLPRAELRGAYERYYTEMLRVADTLVRSFALALGLEEQALDQFFDDRSASLRVIDYPAGAGSQRAGRTPRLRVPHDHSFRRWRARGADAQRRVAPGLGAPRRPRREYRRPHAALDRRPLGVNAAPRCR
jgi:hypothetical protein